MMFSIKKIQLIATYNMLRQESVTSGKPLITIIHKAIYFFLKTKLGPRYFVVAGMARSNFKESDKWKHISGKEYLKALDTLNPLPYRKLTQHKLAEKGLYQLLQIPTAIFLGYFHPVAGNTAQGDRLTNETELRNFFINCSESVVIIKRLEGSGGIGVEALRIHHEKGDLILYSLASKKNYNIEKLIRSFERKEKPSEFIIEKYIKQSSQFLSFNPSSVNTLRLWALETDTAKAEVIGAYLRIGRAGSIIDNASAGGIMCPINLETGELLPGLIKNTPHRDDILIHPDHGAVLAGIIIEQWSHIKQFASNVLLKLPHTRFAGLDITMTEQGAVLVETNVTPDKDGAAHANIPSIKLQQAARRHRV